MVPLDNLNIGDFKLVKTDFEKVLLVGKAYYVDLSNNKKFVYAEAVDSLFQTQPVASYHSESIQDKIYFIEPSGGPVFEFDRKGIQRIDNSFVFRAFYHSKSFVYNGDLYLVGGYGHFKHKSQILKYDFVLKQWVLFDTLLTDAYGFGHALTALEGDDLYILFPKMIENFTNKVRSNNYIIKYNLITKTKTEIPFDFEKFEYLFSNSTYLNQSYSEGSKIGIYNNTHAGGFVEFDFKNNSYKTRALDSYNLEAYAPIIKKENKIHILSRNKKNPKIASYLTYNLGATMDSGTLSNRFVIYYTFGGLVSILTIILVVRFISRRQKFILKKRSLSKGALVLKIDRDEYFFLALLAQNNRVENQELISYFDRDGKSYDLNIKRKNAMIGKLSNKLQSKFKTAIFERIPSSKDKRQGIYILKSTLTIKD